MVVESNSWPDINLAVSGVNKAEFVYNDSLNQLDIHGSWSWNGSGTWEKAVEMVINNKFDFDPLITGRYRLEKWEEAFKNLREGKDIKALIYPNGTNWL